MEKQKQDWISRAVFIAFLDVMSICICTYGALWIRYDFRFRAIPVAYMETALRILPVWIVTLLVLYYCLRLYHSIWIFAGINEVIRVLKAYLLFIPIAVIETLVLQIQLPRGVYLMAYCLSFASCAGIRLSYRLFRRMVRNQDYRIDKSMERILIIGAGQAGRYLIREYQTSNHIHGRCRCVIDDNHNKWGRTIEGVPIIGGRADIPDAVKKYDITRIILAVPSMTPGTRKQILDICKETHCKIQIIPGIYQFINEEVHISQLKDVELQDLLGREEIHVNNQEVREAIHGKVILVTGGGGSIGSELCRQIAASEPKQLIIFDIYENNAYEIQQELQRKYPKLHLVTLIGSVRNTSRVEDIFTIYHPDVVFHAAAHKHVPLMEDSPNEAIKNNVMGTYKVATAAAEHGVKKFLLISTDKAVNPTNIMGASKRLCEMVVQMLNRRYENTDFMAVRFGNVLGSNGSVIPLFEKQIAEGGPVTVTDKNIIRYFMTIPEAVSLVLQASYYAKGGEIFVLDMGEPVRIDDMARNLIKLSGYTPDVDIKITYTGLRPGEKLYEELLMDEEGMTETENELIFIGQPIEMDDELFQKQIEALDAASQEEDTDIRGLVALIVPTYHPEGREIEKAENIAV